MLLADTNKYLAFYQSERISAVIPVLNNIQQHIFVSQLIVDEVERNKVNCFTQALTDQLKSPKWGFPDHLLPAEDGCIKLKEDVDQFKLSAETLRRKMKNSFSVIAQSVATSEDHITKQLADIFEKAVGPTEGQLALARFRKETNNPPGKKSDPLGDELHWEQFLDASSDSDNIWIVSNDQDYFVKIEKDIFLNPLLQRDLQARRERASIRCFETWAKALPDFLSENGLSQDGLPEGRQLDELEAEERSLPTTTTTTPAPWQNSSRPPKPSLCQKCCVQDSFHDGAYLRSQYGGLTLQFVCSNCGYHFDTGDSWD